jgi:hypothetical protein
LQFGSGVEQTALLGLPTAALGRMGLDVKTGRGELEALEADKPFYKRPSFYGKVAGTGAGVVTGPAAGLARGGMALAARLPVAPIAQRAAGGVLGGAGMAGAEPAMSGASPEDIARQTALGGLVGGAIPAAIEPMAKGLAGAVMRSKGAKAREAIEEAGGEVGLLTAGKGKPFVGEAMKPGEAAKAASRPFDERVLETPQLAAKRAAKPFDERVLETPQLAAKRAAKPFDEMVLEAPQLAAKRAAKKSAVEVLGPPEELGKVPGKLKTIHEERFGKPYREALADADASPEADELVDAADILSSLDEALTHKTWVPEVRSRIATARAEVAGDLDEGGEISYRGLHELRQKLNEMAKYDVAPGKTKNLIPIRDAAALAQKKAGPYAEANQISDAGQNWLKKARVGMGVKETPGKVSADVKSLKAALADESGTSGSPEFFKKKYPEFAEEVAAPQRARAAAESAITARDAAREAAMAEAVEAAEKALARHGEIREWSISRATSSAEQALMAHGVAREEAMELAKKAAEQVLKAREARELLKFGFRPRGEQTLLPAGGVLALSGAGMLPRSMAGLATGAYLTERNLPAITGRMLYRPSKAIMGGRQLPPGYLLPTLPYLE